MPVRKVKVRCSLERIDCEPYLTFIKLIVSEDRNVDVLEAFKKSEGKCFLCFEFPEKKGKK